MVAEAAVSERRKWRREDTAVSGWMTRQEYYENPRRARAGRGCGRAAPLLRRLDVQEHADPGEGHEGPHQVVEPLQGPPHNDEHLVQKDGVVAGKGLAVGVGDGGEGAPGADGRDDREHLSVHADGALDVLRRVPDGPAAVEIDGLGSGGVTE